MSDRDRQQPYGRSQQRSGAYRDEAHYRQQQPYQSQSDDHRQPGGDWQDDGRGDRSYRQSGYRFSGQGEPYREDYDSQEDWNMRRRSPRSGPREQVYHPRDFDASGGNDFGNFTSEDYGGRDFYNRDSPSGGMRSSESYRPSYGVSSWFRSDHDHDRSGDYSGWRDYGESRGFLQRAGDEVASWFGDDDASRRREMDKREMDTREDHRGRGPANYTRSDERIFEDANDHLTHDWTVDASNITVTVRDGEVTLDGTVDSRQAKRRAEDCVDGLSGVKHVQNNLRVQDRSAGAYRSGSTSGWRENGRSDAATQERDSEFSSGNDTTAANTTNGIGSSATAGVINASAPRSSDKPS
ncbi:BON domain-containing protein [Novosphingobium sp. RD2P27]|uniref:BON domain-containing protein n=1 Tax=Novosphingobium kalidii TaxID=3230299 RepID=A0ABV2CWQ8_9SPHN